MTKLISPAPKGWESADWMDYTNHRGKDYGWYNADIAGSRRVVAAAAGRVVEVYGGGGDNLGWGNRVVIEHASGVRTTYNHLATGSILCTVGQQLVAGQHIATMGQTGRVSGISLHFELYLNGERVDPNPYFTRDLPGTAPTVVLHPNDRVVGPNGVKIRRTWNTAEPELGLVGPGKWVRMSAFNTAGQNVDGNSLWFQGVDGRWYWSGGFTGVVTAGLANVTPAPPVVVVPEPEPEPEPEPPVEPEVPVEPEPEPEVPVEPEPEVPVEPETPVEPEPEAPVEPEPETPVGPTPPKPATLWTILATAILVVIGTVLGFLQGQ